MDDASATVTGRAEKTENNRMHKEEDHLVR
jgi:hypothetical protein